MEYIMIDLLISIFFIFIGIAIAGIQLISKNLHYFGMICFLFMVWIAFSKECDSFFDKFTNANLIVISIILMFLVITKLLRLFINTRKSISLFSASYLSFTLSSLIYIFFESSLDSFFKNNVSETILLYIPFWFSFIIMLILMVFFYIKNINKSDSYLFTSENIFFRILGIIISIPIYYIALIPICIMLSTLLSHMEDNLILEVTLNIICTVLFILKDSIQFIKEKNNI